MEKVSFFTHGTVKTADGKEIAFSIKLNITREFAANHEGMIKDGDAAIDPLAINFGGNAPELTESKFLFDLDCDGKGDLISFIRPGSGFLALDANNDGQINNGRELFGPTSGNGFTELACHDSDGNGWIDENDEIYHRLRIWSADEKGNHALMALGQVGVGAIFLGSISTPFGIKDGGNKLLGRLRKTDVFLYENGSAGTIQHIDLVV